MQFPNQIVTEITAPNNVPFLPGNVVTGFGSIIPAELTAAGFVNAIVFYDSDWNPTNTTPTIKFRFIASGFGNIKIGYGYCANPSVSQTATVVSTANIGAQISGSSIFSLQEWRSLANATTFIMGHTFGTNDPLIQMYDQNANLRMVLQRVAATAISSIAFGSWSISIADAATIASVSGRIDLDTAWVALPLTGGWTGDATRVPLMRRMNDGTVQMKGLITKVANPVSGEAWITGLAAAYRPTHTWTFLTPTPGRAYNGSQVVEVHADGTSAIFDMAALSGNICLDMVRYTTM